MAGHHTGSMQSQPTHKDEKTHRIEPFPFPFPLRVAVGPLINTCLRSQSFGSSIFDLEATPITNDNCAIMAQGMICPGSFTNDSSIIIFIVNICYTPFVLDTRKKLPLDIGELVTKKIGYLLVLPSFFLTKKYY